MKTLAILGVWLAGLALCLAPPTYGPFPTGTGGGLSSNEVYAIALSVGGPTNGISAATATNIVNNNNAANLTPGVLVNPVNGAGITNITGTNVHLDASAKQIIFGSSIGLLNVSPSFQVEVGLGGYDTLTVGEEAGIGGKILLSDDQHDVFVGITTTNGTIYFPNHVTMGEGSSYAHINGVNHGFLNAQQHSVAEPIYYWGGHSLAAQAWLVGSYEEGLTNGRFSFLVGELGLGWNIGRSTNSGSDVTYMTGDTSQNITNTVAWLNGPTGPELKAVMSYRRDDNRNIIGGAVRGTTIVGTNVLVSVGTTTFEISSNGVFAVAGGITANVVLPANQEVSGAVQYNSGGRLYASTAFWYDDSTGLSIGVAGNTGALRLYDATFDDWFLLSGDAGQLSVTGPVPITISAAGFTANQTNVVSSSGSSINAVGLTNGNVTIPGTLSVSGATTAGTLYSPSISGDGLGITNAVDLIAGNNITITTNANKRSFTIDSTGGTSGALTNNETRDITIYGDMLFEYDGNESGRIIAPWATFTTIRALGNTMAISNGSINLRLNYVSGDVTNFVFTGAQVIADGSGITNINAANISGDLVVETLTVATQYVADAIIGNGRWMTNLLGTNIVYCTNAIADMSAIDMTKPYAAISTNNNFVISGLSGLVAAGNQVQWATRFYTNTSGSTKTITVPAAWVDIGSIGTTIYNTNQGVLSVTRYPGFGTNFVWRGK